MLMRLRWLLLMVGVLISTDGQGWSATAWAQSLDELQRQRLITPAVRDVLESTMPRLHRSGKPCWIKLAEPGNCPPWIVISSVAESAAVGVISACVGF